MDKSFRALRNYLKKRRYNVKRIHKSWVDLGTGAKAVFTDLMTAAQALLIVVAYAILARLCNIFFFVSLIFTAFNGIYVLLTEPDFQTKISWILLFVLSFGCGYIIYILSSKPVTYGIKRCKYKKVNEKVKPLVPASQKVGATETVRSDLDYLESNGFPAFNNTDVKYYPYARAALDNIIARIDAAEKFVFMEFFIVADGVLLDRLISVFRRKTAQGVEIRLLYDDVGSAGVFSSAEKKRIKDAGVKIKAFSKLLSPFYFGLDFRDHRKIVVVDGKTGYVGGFNMIDDCANERNMEGVWKDAGLRLDGEAVDGLSLCFMRQWEFATGEKLDNVKYLGHYVPTGNSSRFAPYAGGPEMKEALCRGVYMRLIEGAKERIWIMTPYLIPDSKFLNKLKEKAAAGVDVRLVLPGVPDYRYIYRVTQSNARRLSKRGIKVYYAGGEFVHSKVMLTENAAAVGSINLDMRAFYQEFDNGVYSDDASLLLAVSSDFRQEFLRNGVAEVEKFKPVSACIASFLRIFSPLM